MQKQANRVLETLKCRQAAGMPAPSPSGALQVFPSTCTLTCRWPKNDALVGFAYRVVLRETVGFALWTQSNRFWSGYGGRVPLCRSMRFHSSGRFDLLRNTAHGQRKRATMPLRPS